LKDVKPQDVLTPLTEKMAPGFTDNYNIFMEQVKKDQMGFTPMGDKVYEYTVNGVGNGEDIVYEMYKVSTESSVPWDVSVPSCH
jgi:uncharacterized protein YdhG (YjbR/CyaY superfamily)